MVYTKLGRTGFEITRIRVGCRRRRRQMGAIMPGASARRRADRSSSALDAGINFFDTANRYVPHAVVGFV